MRRTPALGCCALCAFSLQAETRYVSILSWLLLVGTFLQSRGQWETAELYLTNGLRAFPDNPDYPVALTALHETWATRAADRPESLSVTQTARAKHLQKAESYARRALESDPTSSEPLLRLAAIRSNRGHPDEAISLLRELLARQHLPPRVGALGHLFLGRLHEACGEGDIAATQYRSAIALDPDSQTPRLALARLLAASGDRASAATILREAQRSDVSDGQMDVWTAYQASQLRPLDELLRILRTRGEG